MVSNRLFIVVHISVILILIALTPVTASQVNTVMENGNSFYRNGEYDNAIEEYKKLVDEGFLGTSLFYNLGNSYYRIGKIGYAILYYEKALKLSPSDADVKHNLDFAHFSTIDRIQPLPKFFLFDWWEALLNSFSVNGWAYVVFIFYLLILLLIAAYFFAKLVSQQKFIFLSGIVIVVLFTLSVSLLVVKINREATLKNGVIVEQVVTVKFSPDPQSTDSFVIHEGLKVNLEDKLDNWVKIRLADGKVGWIENNVVKRI
ncbi:MAG: tetratricopeptide repeat protein [Ignavibacteria bacterium]|nr:MAG: tetratricopeptide repeat protein [Ignavibacteria bacterium]